VRIASYEPFLREHGIELSYRPTLTAQEYLTVASKGSVASKLAVLAASGMRAARKNHTDGLLLVHRLRLMSPLPGFDPPRHLDAYDIDDALFLGSAAPVNRGFQWAKQEARRCVACLRRANLVIAGNDFLAVKAREYARRVEVVPSCVDPARQRLHSHDSREVVKVGWIGSATTSAYLTAVLPALAALNERRPQVRLVVIGGQLKARPDWIECRPWSLEREGDELADFDIGIMPLPDTDWARGKCGYKLLQYFSAGVPAVASPVGVTPQLIGSERGILANSTEEWLAALERLTRDVAERRERGMAARAFVESRYSYRRWAPELATMLRSLAG
jgi:glycosyltransferase involved in cell wall biosynthesis